MNVVALSLVLSQALPAGQEPKEIADFYHERATPGCIAFFGEDGLVCGTNFKEICIWNVKDKKKTPFKVLKEHRKDVGCVTYNGANAFVAAGPDGAKHSIGERINTAKVVHCDLSKGGKTTVLQIPGSHIMDLSPGGKFLVVRDDFGPRLSKIDRPEWYNDKSASVYRIPSEEKVITLDGHDAQISATKFAPDQKTLAIATFSGQISIWDLEKRKKTCTLFSKDRPYLLAFTPDLKYFFSKGTSQKIQKWDLFQKKLVQEITIPGAKVIAVSPDGERLAVGASSRVWLFDAFSGKEIANWPGDQGFITCLCFSKDSKTLAAGGQRGIIRLWKLPEIKR